MRKMRLFLFVAVAMAAALSMVYVGCSDNNVVNPTAPSLGNYGAEAVAKAIVTQEAYTAEVMQIPGVVGCGLGLDESGKLAIKVFTAEAATSDLYAGKIAREVGGYPVVTEEIGYVTAMGYTGTYRPVPIGVSVGNVTPGTYCMAGTLGCVVTKNGVKYMLSNNHVLARENEGAIGENIQQPGSLDTKPQCYIIPANYVAVLSDFVTIASKGNTMDAAIARYTIADNQISCGFANNPSNPPGTTPLTAAVGMAIKKVGRTTGLTTGTVTAINATINVGYDFGTAQFTGQIVTSRRFCKSGDSGSLVVTNNTAENPVGLLFAGTQDGTTICNPIGAVLQRFGVTVCGQ